MSPQTASKIRRPVQYWKPFNTWWRQAFDKTGRRPEAAAINRWYEENAHITWSPDEMPTMTETRIHAKCLRSVEEVRMYFRKYRAAKRADATTGPDQGDMHQVPSDSGSPSEELYAPGVIHVPKSEVRKGPTIKLGITVAKSAQRGVSKVSSAGPGGGGYPPSRASSIRSGGAAMSDDEEEGLARNRPRRQAALAAQAARRQAYSCDGAQQVSTPQLQSNDDLPASLHLHMQSLAHPKSPSRGAASVFGHGGRACVEMDAQGLPGEANCSSVSTASLGALLKVEEHHDPMRIAAGHPEALDGATPLMAPLADTAASDLRSIFDDDADTVHMHAEITIPSGQLGGEAKESPFGVPGSCLSSTGPTGMACTGPGGPSSNPSPVAGSNWSSPSMPYSSWTMSVPQTMQQAGAGDRGRMPYQQLPPPQPGSGGPLGSGMPLPPPPPPQSWLNPHGHSVLPPLPGLPMPGALLPSHSGCSVLGQGPLSDGRPTPQGPSNSRAAGSDCAMKVERGPLDSSLPPPRLCMDPWGMPMQPYPMEPHAWGSLADPEHRLHHGPGISPSLSSGRPPLPPNHHRASSLPTPSFLQHNGWPHQYQQPHHQHGPCPPPGLPPPLPPLPPLPPRPSSTSSSSAASYHPPPFPWHSSGLPPPSTVRTGSWPSVAGHGPMPERPAGLSSFSQAHHFLGTHVPSGPQVPPPQHLPLSTAALVGPGAPAGSPSKLRRHSQPHGFVKVEGTSGDGGAGNGGPCSFSLAVFGSYPRPGSDNASASAFAAPKPELLQTSTSTGPSFRPQPGTGPADNQRGLGRTLSAPVPQDFMAGAMGAAVTRAEPSVEVNNKMQVEGPLGQGNIQSAAGLPVCTPRLGISHSLGLDGMPAGSATPGLGAPVPGWGDEPLAEMLEGDGLGGNWLSNFLGNSPCVDALR